MNNRRIIQLLFVLLALALIVPAYVHLLAQRAQATQTSFYIDYSTGNDSNSGTQSSPWKTFQNVTDHTYNPGDSILLEDGDRWTDNAPDILKAFFHPLGSGTGTPIGGVMRISDYCDAGEGSCSTTSLPELDGQGDMATVELLDQSYWEISNLTITNKPDLCFPPPRTPICTNALRYGVYVFDDSKSLTTYHHIYVTNLTVYNVVGYSNIQGKPDATTGKVTGGIIFETENLTGHPLANVGNYHSSFDDIHINTNIIHDVYRSGIFMHSDWQDCINNDCPHYKCSLTNKIYWVPSTNVIADSNTVYNTGGTGIDVQVSTGQVISNNIVHDGQLDGWAAEGIASLDSYQPIYKKNQVYNMQYHNADSNGYPTDAVAFDTDDCDLGAIVEYNFSHDNQGGFMTVPLESQQDIVRYNISERDGYGSSIVHGHFTINTPTPPTGSGMQVYNNTIFMDDNNHGSNPPGTDLLQHPFDASEAVTPLFENNLVDNQQTGASASCSTDKLLPSEGLRWAVNYNDFWGASAYNGVCPQTPMQSNSIHGDPEFAHPGNGYLETTIAGVITDYTLQAASPASPALCTGTIVTNSGGLINGGQDFAGRSLLSTALVSGVDAGALEVSASCP